MCKENLHIIHSSATVESQLMENRYEKKHENIPYTVCMQHIIEIQLTKLARDQLNITLCSLYLHRYS